MSRDAGYKPPISIRPQVAADVRRADYEITVLRECLAIAILALKFDDSEPGRAAIRNMARLLKSNRLEASISGIQAAMIVAGERGVQIEGSGQLDA